MSEDHVEKNESYINKSTKIMIIGSFLIPLYYALKKKTSKTNSSLNPFQSFQPFQAEAYPSPPNAPESTMANSIKKEKKKLIQKRSRKRSRKKTVKRARVSQTVLWESSPPKELKKMSREELIESLKRFRDAWQKKTDKHADLDDVRLHHETDDELRQLLSFYYSDAARKMARKI